MIRTTVAFKGSKTQSKALRKSSVSAQTVAWNETLAGADKFTYAARVLDTALSLRWAAHRQAKKPLKTGLGY